MKSQYLAFDELLISSAEVIASRLKNKDKTSCLAFPGTGLSSMVGDGPASVIFCDLTGDKDA